MGQLDSSCEKTDSSQRLYLDPRDLNKNIKQNKLYSKTIDDILLDLPVSTLFTLLDAKSVYWHVILDRESSLMTIFSTPWGNVAEVVFQESLDRVLRGIQNIHNISDAVLVDGKAEVPHDKSTITLLETARANNITFNCDMLFDGNMAPERYKVDPKKVHAITEMKPLQNLLRSSELPGTSQPTQLLQSKQHS